MIKELKAFSNPKTAKHSQRFFKTGKGQYGEGDRFLGIRVPLLRKIAKKYGYLSLNEVSTMLKSPFHEIRLASLFILINSYQKADQNYRRKIVNLYLKHTSFINNWDLVDASAHKILGDYLLDKKKDLLYKLAKSQILWERRISIITTLKFIKAGSYHHTMNISELLIGDKEDLTHKAVGWMLREVGKKNFDLEITFLNKYAKIMPRTMLRYSIENFPENIRQKYLNLS